MDEVINHWQSITTEEIKTKEMLLDKILFANQIVF
jgi:hypothetical protein